jgi:hypothetical protein
MKKYLVLCLYVIFTIGCVEEKKDLTPPVIEVIEKKEVQISDESSDNTEKKIIEKKKEKVNEMNYKVITSKLEVFTYKGKYNRNSFDDKKLIQPFYMKTKTVKIERIYTSKNGEKYGKLSGKHLFVSMDDIKAK